MTMNRYSIFPQNPELKPHNQMHGSVKEHNLEIHCFRLTWPCLSIEVLEGRVKCLEISDYRTVVNCAFTFRRTNVFRCFCGIMAQFEIVKIPKLNCVARSSGRLSNQTWNETMCKLLAHQPQRVPLTVWPASVSWYTSHKLTRTKTFNSPKYIYIYI